MKLKRKDVFCVQGILHDILLDDKETPVSDRDWIKDVRKQYKKLYKLLSKKV